MAAHFLLALALCMQAQEPDPTVQDFKRYFRKAKDPVERVEFVFSLEGIDHPGVADVLLPVLKDKEPMVVEAVKKVLGKLPSAASRAPMLKIVEKGKPVLELDVILRSAAEGRWTEFLPLLRPHLGHDDAGVRLWAVTAVSNMEDGESLAQVVGIAGEDKNTLVRVAAIEGVVALGKGHEDLCVPALIAGLDDEASAVQIAACIGLRTLRHYDAIEPLLEVWEEGEGIVLLHIYPTLVEITDLQFGDDCAQWRRWWERAREEYQIPSEEEVAKRREGREQTAALYVPKEGVGASFAGIQTPSREVVFVIDISGSMEDSVLEREKFRQRGHTRFTKIDIIKKELSEAIDSLGSNVVFNVHAFASGIDSWRKKLVPANALNKKSAKQYVRKLKPLGGAAAQERAAAGLTGSAGVEAGRTNTYGALLVGLGIHDTKVRQAVTRSSATEVKGAGDTMFFFSDGLPTVGEMVDTDEILEAIGKFNQFRGISIHTIAIGDFKKTWMMMLAAENGGQHADLGR